MNIDTFLGYFSSNLYLKRIGDTYCVIDSYQENDEDYNYGVYTEFKDINSVEPLELIPDVYVDGLIQFLLTDDLPNEYNLDEKVISKIERDLNVYGLEMLDKSCWSNGAYSVSKTYSPMCQVLRGELSLTFNWEKIAKRYESILYDAICWLEDEGYWPKNISKELCLDKYEYIDIINSHSDEQ